MYQKPIAVGALTLLFLSACAGPMPPISPTDAVLVSPEEYGEIMSTCLVASGWQAEPDAAGGVQAEYDTDDADEFMQDYKRCLDDTGLSDPVVLSERQWSMLYEDYVSTIECLQSHGIDIPEAIDEHSFRSAGLGAHFAYERLPEKDYERLSELEKVCPQPEVQY